MKRLWYFLALVMLSTSASAQIKNRFMLPVYDPQTKVVQAFTAYQELCLGDTPAIYVFAVGPDSIMKPFGVLPWPSDKPNPCKGIPLPK